MENEKPYGNEPLHIPSEQSDSYQPEDFGLVLSNEADLDLWNESQGNRMAAEVLVERRKLTEAYLEGLIPPEQYDIQLKTFNETVAEILEEQAPEAP